MAVLARGGRPPRTPPRAIRSGRPSGGRPGRPRLAGGPSLLPSARGALGRAVGAGPASPRGHGVATGTARAVSRARSAAMATASVAAASGGAQATADGSRSVTAFRKRPRDRSSGWDAARRVTGRSWLIPVTVKSGPRFRLRVESAATTPQPYLPGRPRPPHAPPTLPRAPHATP